MTSMTRALGLVDKQYTPPYKSKAGVSIESFQHLLEVFQRAVQEGYLTEEQAIDSLRLVTATFLEYQFTPKLDRMFWGIERMTEKMERTLASISDLLKE